MEGFFEKNPSTQVIHESQMNNTILFVGGTRSGKSAMAQRWTESCGLRRLYVATAYPTRGDTEADAELHERIAAHKAARGKGWTTLENPALCLESLHNSVVDPNTRPDAILVDCLTLWLGHLFMEKLPTHDIVQRVAQLALWAQNCSVPVAFVSSEVGHGIVPVDALSRTFRDAHGLINQHMAAACKNVVFVSCGLPLVLKGSFDDLL